MLFDIDHLTRYDYSVPVQLGEHLLRLVPAERPGQRQLGSRVDISPEPAGREPGTDAWGNPVERVWFDGETASLQIRAHLQVETFVPRSCARPSLPAAGLDSESDALASYREPLADAATLAAFLHPLQDQAGTDTEAFLDALNQAVHGLYHRGVRLDGPPHSPAQTLALGQGVCRDLAVLFMASCRQQGLAARFVSGYQQGDGTGQRRYLHAWPEVYLPGSGWTGFDPTHGTRTGDDHVAVAAAPDPAAVTPVEGGYTFCGESLTSTLETDIRISTRRAG